MFCCRVAPRTLSYETDVVIVGERKTMTLRVDSAVEVTILDGDSVNYIASLDT